MVPFVTQSPIYRPEDIIQVLNISLDEGMLVALPRGKKDKETIYLYNVPCAFDIETTSFYIGEGDDAQKAATMYIWQFGINGNVIMGRTWGEFLTMMETIKTALHLRHEKQLVIYVHNLGFEFQFMRKYFTWERVFAIDSRKPVEAVTIDGLHFKCSFLLSGYSLANLGGELQKYKVQKMDGDLDYSLMRHCETPLTEKELKYCENDVRVVMAYIQEKIESDGNIAKIELTKTGYVRRYCREACLYTGKSHKKGAGKFNRYKEMIEALTIMDSTEYFRLKHVFQGGFTHANMFWSEQVIEDVVSYDFTSSYPFVMVSEMFPMSSGQIVTIHSIDEFYSYLKRYCCMFKVTFENLVAVCAGDCPISSSKCEFLGKEVIDNGRVVCAARLTTAMTEQDFAIASKFYKWDRITVSDMYIYEKGYLPTDFVKAILTLYRDKTTLKDVEGKEAQYLFSKGLLNACYGMTVTDIIRDDNEYTSDHEWKETKVMEKELEEIQDELNHYNTGKKRFLFYPWGVWVTAYARRNLFTGILEFGEDYIYSDTDSIKVKNYQKHQAYINGYNEAAIKKLKRALAWHNRNGEKISYDMVEPCTVKGVKKPLGVWDFDGHYSRFKTLGAKRYLVEYANSDLNPPSKRGKINLTVSGVNKKAAVPYLLKTYGKEGIFDAFDNYLYIPPEYTGKNTHTYIDDEVEGDLIDYKGNVGHFHELSCTHLEAADYSLSMSVAYLNLLKGIRQVEK